METFAALVWMASFAVLTLVYVVVIAINGTTINGWLRTSRFYVWSSLLTWPIPLLVLFQRGPPAGGMLLALAAAFRQMVCLPLVLLGLWLAIKTRSHKWALKQLIFVSVLNGLLFVYIYLVLFFR